MTKGLKKPFYVCLIKLSNDHTGHDISLGPGAIFDGRGESTKYHDVDKFSSLFENGYDESFLWIDPLGNKYIERLIV